ncbi:hypothetical protein ACGFNU_46635 [Spirillospora sp. NPDC048911]|uniref:hypothetical protein n=1 Tax=Spirillospora sp. NPDC048911 TaxID=3364527 RepID=UPI003712E3B4
MDVAMVLRDVMLPLPMRPEWCDDLEWPYPGLPSAVVAEFAGHKVAGLPFFTPETVTTDHGAVYRNHHLVEVQRVLGCNILPARVLRPTDKHAVERAFGAIRSLLFEELPGYTGIDVADRGADPEGDAVLAVEEMEHVIATWIVVDFTDRGSVNPHSDLRLLKDYMSATEGVETLEWRACRNASCRASAPRAGVAKDGWSRWLLNAGMDSQFWNALPEDALVRVDGLIRAERKIQAIQVLRESLPEPRPGLYDCMDMVAERCEELGVRFAPEPTQPLSVDAIAAEIRGLSWSPAAIEAEWDGDSFGWMVVLSVVGAEPGTEHCVENIRPGTELRLFHGEAPLPEAKEATRVGNLVADRFGIPFYFASPDQPEIDLPRWWDTVRRPPS